ARARRHDPRRPHRRPGPLAAAGGPADGQPPGRRGRRARPRRRRAGHPDRARRARSRRRRAGPRPGAGVRPPHPRRGGGRARLGPRQGRRRDGLRRLPPPRHLRGVAGRRRDLRARHRPCLEPGPRERPDL
ncbi:MAG: Inosine-5'-monophosphate dehydrogenase, partial [uncultured Frankineae bacterium]